MLTFIILSFVVFRVSRFIVHDTLIDEPRAWVMHKLGGHYKVKPTGEVYMPKWREKLLDLIQCQWCIGIWVAAATTAVADQFTSIPLPALFALGIAGLSSFLWTNAPGV